MLTERRNVLIVGGGGREHALAWRLRQSPRCGRLLCAPGNPGMGRLPDTACLPIPATDVEKICEVLRREAVDLVVIGPEAPLWGGLADTIAAQDSRIAVFGCSKRAAEIEASKVFAKAFMFRHGIPTAAHAVAHSEGEAAEFLRQQVSQGRPAWVVKADGLCAGKGVVVCDTPEEALLAVRTHFRGGARRAAQPVVPVVIEERLHGREASIMALCDGEDVALLPACEDHKSLGEGDTGPMTGGMGALCPTPVVDEALRQQLQEQVLLPAARGLLQQDRPFHGLLYAGIMCTREGPKVLEFNCRFGDPETQALMMVLDEDLLVLLEAVGRRQLSRTLLRTPRLRSGAALCVTLAAAGYPATPRLGDPITGVDAAEASAPGQVVVFHAGTALGEDGALRTAGGRVLSVTAHAEDLPSARRLAYRAAAEIHFAGAYLRRDIGAR